VSQNTELDPQAFNTASGYDWLTVNGARYMGTNLRVRQTPGHRGVVAALLKGVLCSASEPSGAEGSSGVSLPH